MAQSGAGTLSIAFPDLESADAKSMDPGAGGGTTYVQSIYGALYDILVYQDPNTGNVVPGLAKSWEISPDGKQYTFHLAPEAKFWDGTPVTAEDVKYTLDRTVDPKYLPGNAYTRVLMANYDGSEVNGPHDIRVKLKQVQPNFLVSVIGRTYFGIISKTYIEKIGFQEFGRNPMGSGPFIFVEWRRGDSITVQRNPNYTWGPAFFKSNNKPPAVDRIVFRFLEDDSTRIAALESGQVNAIIGVPPLDEDRIGQNPRFLIVKVRKNGQPGGFYFNSRQGLTSALAVRQAIAYAVDRDAINQSIYQNKFYPAYYVLEERMGEWLNKSARFPDYDPARAKKILDDAGWKLGSDGVREKQGKKLILKTITRPDVRDAMTLVQAQLSDIGVQLDIEATSSSQALNIATDGAGKFDILWSNRAGLTNEDPNVLRYLFAPSSGPPKGLGNFGLVVRKDIDDDLIAASTISDHSARKKAYYDIQKKLTDDVPYLPLLSFNLDIATAKNVSGLMPDIRGTYTYFNDVQVEK